MNRSFNALSLLSMLGFLGFLAFIGNGYDSTVIFSLAYFFYLGYLWIRPDELFWQYVLKAAAYALALGMVFLSVWVVIYYVAQSDESFIIMGFWISYALLHTGFNAILLGLLSQDRLTA